jgi:hypothetical protein
MSLIKKEVLLPMIVTIVIGGILGLALGSWLLQPQIQTLNESFATTQSQLDAVDSTLTKINQAYVTASLRDPRLTSYYLHSVQGVVINFGNETANNIVITVKWFKDGASFHQEIIEIPSLAGRGIKEIDFNYSFEGQADDFQYTATWE